MLLLFKPILFSKAINYYSNFRIFNFLITNPTLWLFTRGLFILFSFIANFIILKFVFSYFLNYNKNNLLVYKAPTFRLIYWK